MAKRPRKPTRRPAREAPRLEQQSERGGGRAELSPCAQPDDVAARCVALADELGLELAGIDILLAGSGETYCFEVNPGPAVSDFEAQTGQPIARAIARALADKR